MHACARTDGTWAKWHLETKNGEDGVHWIEAFKPVYFAGMATSKAFRVASGLVGRLNPWHHHHPRKVEQQQGSSAAQK